MGKHLPIPYWLAPDVQQRCRDFDAWDDERRREAGFFAGLRLFKMTGRRFRIACRHWPHLLCWQWILAVDFMPFRGRALEFRRSGPGAAGGLHWSLRFLWLFSLDYQRQGSDRIAALGPIRASAPKIFRHEAANAD